MGLIERILRWLVGSRPIKRNVARLDLPEVEDAVDEVVDIGGGPLKPHHNRLAIRDRRLLPKKKPIAATFIPRRRKKVMTAGEANRLFAVTLRTRDRNIRDLLPDEAQLNRLGLPIWRTEADLALALGLTVGQLRFFSIHRAKETAPHYVTFAIPKRGGGSRRIMAPKRRLKAIQRQLLDLLVSRLPVSPLAHGFRPGRSIRTGAEPHVGQAVVVHLDIRDFFPTLHMGRVRGLLVAYGYGYPVAATLAVLMTEALRQPVRIDETVFHVPVGTRHTVQGAPTSPGLANALFLRADRRLAGLARSLGFAYTRYADDLTFSGPEPDRVPKLIALVRKILAEEGFELNFQKTRVMRRGRRQAVTGVTVNDVLGLSRRQRRRMRAMLHQADRDRLNGTLDPDRERRLTGKLAYLAMLNPDQAAALKRER